MMSGIFPQHGTMIGKVQRHHLRSTAFYLDRGLFRTHGLPLALVPVLEWIRGIEFLDVEVLLIYVENRQSPGNALVMSDGNTRERWLAGADHVPAGSNE